ncbi:putative chimeric spermidine synthase/saccharopine reductase [Tilletiaria anomala UBC 951]|uniref:Putative chimeric spermidine synthase/saccharopine reductase n=1 Tax=Tilletiaria anomala (strain ATCC 24038 / CBS 436.72 / UBC 951) TaxID=1037660 RepID=A0A066W4W7_TILAU|nr:putative chimeric spermidine synthase/saccharopine reductase [Tilletiaria anomala UBC 951]KDN46124.1 putative chimeric spermidine synthase/saccharopine reductase [Tilletiaria anomala UBC 951]
MSAPAKVLSHPQIRDGWFHEANSQWPGQAMSLQVVRILHHEQSKYQDVLVFESATYGNVLVLDGVIQCTERDEFSYQEMIAHLPLASHPNPKRVLVIGGGDGGVLREVVKHETVEEAVLCDIDEAVPRVSKKYLPKMAAGLTHPKSNVIIGDGFAFLQKPENKGTFDVIITDSSDPVGPAQALFEKPYFQLLKDALKPGGHISTQAECTWLHLPLIRELRKSTKELFPVADYAFTTIPTYPCGQIGFVVCSLQPDRNVREAVRRVPDCKYYNDKVHKAAFVLPEFARRVIEDGAPAPGAVIATGDGEGPAKRDPKKVLLLGSGYVARPFAEYILRYPEYSLTVASAHLENAQRMSVALPRTTAVSIDVSDAAALGDMISKHDVVVSLIPYTFHAAVIKAACKHKVDVVTTSYVSDAIRELKDEIKKAGITVMNEIGLDPGIDHLYAVKAIDDIHREGGKIKSFLSYCGGLPAPEAADNPLGYKFSWSSRGVLLALRNTAKFYQAPHKEAQVVSGTELMASAKPFYISPAFSFVAYPNRDSTPFREWYNIPEAETVIRGTLRYQGFPEFVLALVKCGFLDEEAKPYLNAKAPTSWAKVTAQAVGAKAADAASLAAAVRACCAFKNEDEAETILRGMRWLDLFDDSKPATVRGTSAQNKEGQGNLLDTLCATLEEKCRYEDGERDMVQLTHRFDFVDKTGAEKTLYSSLLDYGIPGGHSSMSKLVGVPCAIATKLILEGHPGLKKNGEIVAPYSADVCEPIRAELEKEGIMLTEKYV